MTSSSKNTWTLAPHQHQGPHQETGEDAHILSPEKHNGNFKAEGCPCHRFARCTPTP